MTNMTINQDELNDAIGVIDGNTDLHCNKDVVSFNQDCNIDSAIKGCQIGSKSFVNRLNEWRNEQSNEVFDKEFLVYKAFEVTNGLTSEVCRDTCISGCEYGMMAQMWQFMSLVRRISEGDFPSVM